MLRSPVVHAIALLLCSSLEASAHASLLESVPYDGAIVAAGDLPIELRFDSRLDSRFSQVTVLKSDGSRSVLTPQGGNKPNVLKATGTRLGEGSYLLHWRILGVDGHASQGQIRFSVGR